MLCSPRQVKISVKKNHLVFVSILQQNFLLCQPQLVIQELIFLQVFLILHSFMDLLKTVITSRICQICWPSNKLSVKAEALNINLAMKGSKQINPMKESFILLQIVFQWLLQMDTIEWALQLMCLETRFTGKLKLLTKMPRPFTSVS